MFPVSQRPAVEVAVWGTMSRFSHTIVSPGATGTRAGSKAMPRTTTCTVRGPRPQEASARLASSSAATAARRRERRGAGAPREHAGPVRRVIGDALLRRRRPELALEVLRHLQV